MQNDEEYIEDETSDSDDENWKKKESMYFCFFFLNKYLELINLEKFFENFQKTLQLSTSTMKAFKEYLRDVMNPFSHVNELELKEITRTFSTWFESNFG